MPHKTFKSLCYHLAYICGLSIALLYMFFYIALPRITHKGKVVQVPDLTGVHLDELETFISKYRLRYAIADHNGYSSQLPPLTVLQQFPAAGASVKENRKVYLTLNATHPPLVAMPNLIEGSMRHAQLLLKNQDLKLGTIKYVPDITKNAVLEQWHNGHPIAAGQPIHKGSTIDLVVGMGLSKQLIEVPNVIDMPLEEAQLILLECGMRIGIIHTVKNSDLMVGRIVQQDPLPDGRVPIGTVTHLWVVGLPSGSNGRLSKQQ